MKKFWLLSVIMFLLLTSFCSKQEKNNQEINEESPLKLFSLKNSGWDIYEGENYRYGPSIIINDDGSIDAWFAAVGDFYGNWNELYNKNGNNSAHPVSAYGSVGQKFTADVPFWGVKVVSPNWHGQPCGLTLKLFKWDDPAMSYADVVAQKSGGFGKIHKLCRWGKTGSYPIRKISSRNLTLGIVRKPHRSIGSMVARRRSYRGYQLPGRYSSDRKEPLGSHVVRRENQR